MEDAWECLVLREGTRKRSFLLFLITLSFLHISNNIFSYIGGKRRVLLRGWSLEGNRLVCTIRPMPTTGLPAAGLPTAYSFGIYSTFHVLPLVLYLVMSSVPCWHRSPFSSLLIITSFFLGLLSCLPSRTLTVVVPSL